MCLITYADINIKQNEIKSAKIIYDITGGGILTPDNNLSIKGTEKLYIKSSGNIQLNKLELRETIEGIIYDISIKKHIQKYENNIIYDVDFNQKVIVKYINSLSHTMIDITNLEQNGTEIIATYECDIWKNDNKKVCLYKGIPLLIEKKYLEFIYSKRVKFALFDFNISDNFFTLPDFHIENNALLKSDIKSTNLHNSSFFYEKILQGKDINISKKLRYKFSDNIVKKQKKKLPSLLQYMKKTRECLSLAIDSNGANICVKDLREVTKSLTNSSDINIRIWTKETQLDIMNYLEENILKLQSRMSCIKRVNNIDELSKCMKNKDN